MSLKASCISACGNDIEKAAQLYDFFAKDVKLPDFDIPKPTAYQQVKSIAGEIFGWIDGNQDKIAGAYNFIQSVRHGKPVEMPDNGTPPAEKNGSTAPAEKQPRKQPERHGMRPMKYRPIPHFKGGCGSC